MNEQKNLHPGNAMVLGQTSAGKSFWGMGRQEPDTDFWKVLGGRLCNELSLSGLVLQSATVEEVEVAAGDWFAAFSPLAKAAIVMEMRAASMPPAAKEKGKKHDDT
jgi:hypothetical protein